MKIINVILKVVLCLIIITPVLGAVGLMPEPTADLYYTPQAFAFIRALYDAQYVIVIMGIVFALCIVLIAMGQMAVAALLMLPITVNIVAFHLFLDGGLLSLGALMADVLLALNLYFLYQNRRTYRALWK